MINFQNYQKSCFDILEQSQKALQKGQATQYIQIEEKKTKSIPLIIGLVLGGLGVFYGLHDDNSLLVQAQVFITEHSTSFVVAGALCLAYYLFRKRK